MAAQTLTVLTSHLHLVRRFGLAGGSLSHPLLPSMEAGSTANHSCTRAIAARLTVSEITVFDFQDWLRLNLGPVLQNESNRAVRFSYERHSHGSQGTRTDFGGAAAARSMALNKRPSASKMCSAVSPTAAVLPRLPVPLRFAQVPHVGEVLFCESSSSLIRCARSLAVLSMASPKTETVPFFNSISLFQLFL